MWKIALALVFFTRSAGQWADEGPEHQRCVDTLVGLAGDGDLRAAALCRARLPTEVCRAASQQLGPQPWTQEKIHSACRHWSTILVPRLLKQEGARKGASVEDVVAEKTKSTLKRTTVDKTTGSKLMKESPWNKPPKGVNPFSVAIFNAPAPLWVVPTTARPGANHVPQAPAIPGMPLPNHEAQSQFEKVAAVDTPVVQGKSGLPCYLMTPSAIRGSITFHVGNVHSFNIDAVAQAALKNTVADASGVDVENVTITNVVINPEQQGTSASGKLELPTSGLVQVYFVIEASSEGEAQRAFAQMIKYKSQTKILEIDLWQYLDANGANSQTILVIGMDVHQGSDEDMPQHCLGQPESATPTNVPTAKPSAVKSYRGSMHSGATARTGFQAKVEMTGDLPADGARSTEGSAFGIGSWHGRVLFSISAALCGMALLFTVKTWRVWRRSERTMTNLPEGQPLWRAVESAEEE